MLFTIHPDGGAPIYEQIVAQIIYGVAAESLESGGLIPSVRELAQTLLVHPNTVARAFQDLEREGIVTARRGVGMEVTDGAQALCKAKRRDIIQGRIRQALREAVASGLSADELRRLVEEELTAANGKRRK
jgi:GntR family transcriptional regulator